MPSGYECSCKEMIFTNLNGGNDVQFLIKEELTNKISDLTSKELKKHLNDIFHSSRKVTICTNCKRLAIRIDDYTFELYERVRFDQGTE